MIVYKAAYKFDDTHEHGWMIGQVLDFPGAVTQGRGLQDARRMLGSALGDLAETYILDGKVLPQPNSTATDPDADLEEPIYLLVNGASHIRVIPADAIV